MHLDRYRTTPRLSFIAAGVDVHTFNWRLQRGLSRIQWRLIA